MGTYTDSELYDLFANQAHPEDILNTPNGEMAEAIAELIGNADAEFTRYPDDGDGTVDLYAVVAAIKRVAAKAIESQS